MELSKDIRLFRRTRALEAEIDGFLDNLSQSALVFKHAIAVYVSDGPSEEFEEKLHRVNEMESDADDLRRSIETQLYAQTLIPESRGDVLGLLENLDHIINLMEGALWGFSIEKPAVTDPLKEGFQKLADMSVEAVEAVVLASRAFFRNIDAVPDHNHKVMFYEKEADIISSKLKREIFESDLELAQKIHLRNFVEQIDNVADWSEDVADRLAIYVIKRTI